VAAPRLVSLDMLGVEDPSIEHHDQLDRLAIVKLGFSSSRSTVATGLWLFAYCLTVSGKRISAGGMS
jgi:hypothetical protein